MRHVEQTLQYQQFRSPLRKATAAKLLENERQETQKQAQRAAPKLQHVHLNNFVSRVLEVPEKRRRSFDKHIWQSVSMLRTSSVLASEAAQLLRKDELLPRRLHSADSASRRRSKTFHHDGGYRELSTAEKGIKYGNMVQVFDVIHKDMAALRLELLRRLRGELRCERVDLFLIHEAAQELVVFVHGSWYRTPMSAGLPAYCAVTCETLNVSNPHADSRYNRNLDEHLKLKTSSVLCQPVRGRRGAGDAVAVLQACNKEGGEFTLDDEDTMAVFCQRIAEELADRLAAILVAPQVLSGSAHLVGAKGGQFGSVSHLKDPTTASRTYLETTAEKLLSMDAEEEHSHLPAFHVRGSTPEELEMEKVKLQRRLNYK